MACSGHDLDFPNQKIHIRRAWLDAQIGQPKPIGTTLDIYTHVINKDKLAAEKQVMEAMLKPELVN